jgi:hypothetical protein
MTIAAVQGGDILVAVADVSSRLWRARMSCSQDTGSSPHVLWFASVSPWSTWQSPRKNSSNPLFVIDPVYRLKPAVFAARNVCETAALLNPCADSVCDSCGANDFV